MSSAAVLERGGDLVLRCFVWNPITEMQVFPDFPALVSVFLGLFRAVVGFSEGMVDAS
jgi:hypothetical protein